MKHTIKYLTIGLLGCSLTLSSCSADWLKTIPTGSASKNEILLNTENAKQAINGMCKLMTTQHSAYRQGFNGEAAIMLLYGEYPGENFQFPKYAPGWANMMNGSSTYHDNKNSSYAAYPWYYYYTIIGNANTILEQIDKTKGTKAEVEFIKAEALTFRAYAYHMLLLLYGDSWKDSNNGANSGVVLRLDTSMGDLPLSTQAEVYTQIYNDLDDAIALYKSSGITRQELYEGAKSTVCFPDINVAYAIYAKSALSKEDYSNAVKYAQLAREGYNLMSNDDYKAGFVEPTSEWIWGAFNDINETLYFWSFQTIIAYNGKRAMSYGGTVGNRELIDKVPVDDVRKHLFVYKEVFAEDGEDVNSLINITNDGKFTSDAAADKANKYAKENCTFPPCEIKYPYTNLKFACTALPGVGCIPFLRSSEMLLIEAEANYFLHNETEAQNNLIALNKTSNRNPGYTCDKTGNDLFEEIVLYRGIELWGEGRSWFDHKRWKRNIIRHSFEEGGNFHAALVGELGTDPTFWKWIIPAKESDYNDALPM